MFESFYEIQTPGYDYNKFFHPNVCHVCKQRIINLTSCWGCTMISYCSEEHRMEHLPQHEEMCRAIRRMSMIRNCWDTRGMTKDEWVIHKKQNMQTVLPILRRKLKPYEEQMFLYAKSCGVCHQQHNLEITCLECFSVNQCSDHTLIEIEHDCLQLKISLFLDIDDSLQKPSIKISQCFLPKDIYDVNENYSMELLVERYRKQNTKEYNWEIDDFIYSDSISNPLTLCYAILYLNLFKLIKENEAIVIHIIAGSLTDIQSLSAWEIILHILVSGAKLTIIMVESELNNADIGAWNTCKVCQALNKTLHFEIHSILYEHYIKCSFYMSPNVVIGFNAELRKLGASTIRILQRQNVPLLLTAISASKALDCNDKLNEVLGKCPYPRFIENTFRSCRPYRDPENDIFFPNTYLIFYDNLNFL
ncbi:uncharacterized protein LOC116846894 [Odontomachus brunneus]|uniref:uncharacterized protein LOC116846894 n=1 Tax=Odontomachus brunneus TaxID=486640 RepID=UPI0013F18660|nr:uncharacterized protein LOC116846894 [Odontomachus brunneus]